MGHGVDDTPPEQEDWVQVAGPYAGRGEELNVVLHRARIGS